MLRTHRQRVPAMLVVACVGMMVYAAAGAAPGDGTELAAATTSTTANDGKGSTTKTTEKCEGSTPTTRDGDGKGSTTSTTEKDGDGKGSTTTTRDGSKDGDGKGSTTSTTAEDDSKDGDDKNSTTTTRDKNDVSTAAAVKAPDKGTTETTAKGGSGSSGDDGCKESTTSTTRKDREPTTSTTEKDGRDKTTTTTRKGSKDGDGKGTTTTTRRDRDRPTSPTTEKPDTVEPNSPSGDPGSGGPDSGGSPDPGATPIEPQEAPPYDPGYDEEPVDDSGSMDDPETTGDAEYFDMPEDGPFAEDDEIALAPMVSPGRAQPVFPTLSADSSPRSRSRGKAAGSSDGSSRRRDRDRDQELAAPPMVVSSSGALQASAGMTESAAVSRRLAGAQTSAVAFPADIISTPKVFPINRRDPLAAAALVLLVGVSRELFRVWRRKAHDYWPA